MPAPLERLSAALADRYRIERQLGAGGMATVYLAEDLKHKRRVALKVLRPELAAVLGAERFVQEITTTASLQHPHILPLYDSGSVAARPDSSSEFLYYVMPYIQGETVREKLSRETQFGIEEAVRITAEVADALEYAHQQGVVHRDIKPENILLQGGRAMVADFGIALAVSAAAGGRMTETGLSLGTPHYMSPEQATAEKNVTSRSDVYSLGCVLFEMLTGDPPHTASSLQAIILKIVTDQARPVTELRKSVPPNVAAAVAKALEKLPADRFATAAEFGAALQNPGFTTGPSTRAPVGRTALNKRWCMHHYRAARAAGDTAPRVMVKLGANHLYRGLNQTRQYDVGALLAMLAESETAASFHLLVVGAPGGQRAQFNPQRMEYMPLPTSEFPEGPFGDLLYDDAWALFDLRPLRPILHDRRRGPEIPPALMELAFNFDALLVVRDAEPSTPIPGVLEALHGLR